jgi:hypothetical protein
MWRRRWENRHLRWLRLALHGTALGALGLAALSALLSGLSALAGLVGSSSSRMEEWAIWGVSALSGVSVLVFLEWWAWAVVGLLLLRLVLDIERRVRGEPPESDEPPAPSDSQDTLPEELRRRYQLSTTPG